MDKEKDMNGRILTCVYCGHEYPQNTPSAGSEVLTEHIKVCPRHPMRKAEADIALLRSALVGSLYFSCSKVVNPCWKAELPVVP